MALWGGRFKEKASVQFKKFNDSLPVDYRMAIQDIVGSIAWAQAIHEVGVLNDGELTRLVAALNELKESFGFTYIFISHDLAVVKYMSDQLLVMNEGKIEELDDADVIYNHPKKEYTKKLINAIPKGL